MSILQSGSGEAQELPVGLEWDWKNGDRAVRRWQGTRAQIEAKKAEIQRRGVAISISPEGGSYILTARFDDAQDGNDPDDDERSVVIWSADPQEVQRSIYEFAKQQKGFPEEVVTAIRAAVGKAQSAPDQYGAAAGDVTAAAIANSFDQATALELFDIVLAGTEAQILEPILLRKVLTAPAGYIGAAPTNILKMFTFAGLTAAEPDIDPAVLLRLPSTGYWLKRKPKVETQSNGKVQITQEYQHADDYITFIYGDPIT